MGLHSTPPFVSHFLTHSVPPTIITLFSISSFLWLLLLQFIFTYEESINHLKYIKPSQTLFRPSKTQMYKSINVPNIILEDLRPGSSDPGCNASATHQAGNSTVLFLLHLSLGQCHWYISKHIFDSSFTPPYCVQAECPSLPSQPSSFLKFFNFFSLLYSFGHLPGPSSTLLGH